MDIDELFDEPDVGPEGDAAPKDGEETNTDDTPDGGAPKDGDEPAGSESDKPIDTAKTDTQEDGKDGDEPAPKDGEGEEPIKLTGIEQYLSQFNIEGGMISFDDGESKHFNDLDSDKQAEVLGELHKSNTKTVEDEYGLDEKEVGIINYLRENKTTFEDVVEKTVSQRVNSILASQQVGSIDYDKVENDVLYATFLQNSNPEITKEQIDQDLEKAKSMANYDKIVGGLRDTFKTSQQVEVTKVETKRAADLKQELEDQRSQVIDTIRPLRDVDGIELNDTVKNAVLDTVLSVDDDGDSKFMSEVFSDPEKLFKAAFWYKNGADLIKTKEAFWKKEKSEAFVRGQKSVKTPGKTFTSSTDDNKTTPNHDTSMGGSMDDLYNE